MLGVVAAPASSPLCLMEVAVERLGARLVQPSPTLHFRPALPLVDRPPLSHTPGWTSPDGTSWEMRVASEHCLAHPWDGTRQGEQMHIMGMRTACKACSPGIYLCAHMLVFWCALAVYLRAWLGSLLLAISGTCVREVVVLRHCWCCPHSNAFRPAVHGHLCTPACHFYASVIAGFRLRPSCRTPST